MKSSFELALALPHSAFFWPQLTHVPCALASSIWCFGIIHLDDSWQSAPNFGGNVGNGPMLSIKALRVASNGGFAVDANVLEANATRYLFSCH